jgi:oxygen-dependent protoporphyrinogen oxidase
VEATDVIIVGGGIAGLAAAFELHRRGVPFVLLERGRRAGGVVLSEEVDGFTIDAGPDALLIAKPQGAALCEELGIAGRLMPSQEPRVSYIQRGGRLHPLPAASVLGIPTEAGPFIRTRLFSLPGKLRMGAELFVPRREEESDESIGAFMTRRFGHEARTYLGEPLLAGIYAGNVDRLSMRSLFPRFVDAERRYGSLLRSFQKQPPKPSPKGAFLSLPGGLSEMIEALVAALPANAIRLSHPAARIAVDRTGDVSAFVVEAAGGASFCARTVIVAAPAFAAAGLVREIDPGLAALCDEVPYVSTATIALAFRRSDVAHTLHGSGFVVPAPEGTGILAASWLSSKWAHRAPGDSVLLRTFVGGARDPKALERSDRSLIDRSIAALTPLLGIRNQPILTRVYRWERANPQHEVGHLERMGAIDRMLGSHPGLFLTGSGFRVIGIPDCVADGRATASQAADWLQERAGTAGMAGKV